MGMTKRGKRPKVAGKHPSVDMATTLDPQTRNKRYTPAEYARLRWQREERERVTGNREERGRR